MTLTTPGTSVTASHCPYCALQCAMTLSVRGDGGGVIVDGREFPTNRGGLCKKGWTAAELLASPDRIRQPMQKQDD